MLTIEAGVLLGKNAQARVHVLCRKKGGKLTSAEKARRADARNAEKEAKKAAKEREKADKAAER